MFVIFINFLLLIVKSLKSLTPEKPKNNYICGHMGYKIHQHYAF
uniref:Uncharacterized protein n=1 Tax=Setaria viridis TaxID=4556 RepID=A0A4V6D0K0_SETVI|nr:hypothetical protein SEVIR_9G075833v2 [Setaria viridis]